MSARKLYFGKEKKRAEQNNKILMEISPRRNSIKRRVDIGGNIESVSTIAASLPLQMCLYFNSVYSIAYWITMLVCFIYKVYAFRPNILEYTWWFAASIFWVTAEVVRLLVGYAGNLAEKVPRLLGFLFISVFSLLLQIYFTYFQFQVLPLERIIGLLQAKFIAIEILFGIASLRRLIRISSFRYALHFNDDGTLYIPYDDEKGSPSMAEDMKLEYVARHHFEPSRLGHREYKEPGESAERVLVHSKRHLRSRDPNFRSLRRSKRRLRKDDNLDQAELIKDIVHSSTRVSLLSDLEN